MAGHTRRLGTARDKRVTHGNPGYGVGIQMQKSYLRIKSKPQVNIKSCNFLIKNLYYIQYARLGF